MRFGEQQARKLILQASRVLDSGTAGGVAGSRNEACTSEGRGESKSTGVGAIEFSGARSTLNSGAADTGMTDATGTAGATGVAEGSFSGTVGSKDDVSVEESGATGATGFCATCSCVREGGTTGFGGTMAEATFNGGTAEIGATGRGAGGKLLANVEPTETGAGATGRGTEVRRSPGKRMPQKPTTDSVNSSSTYPLTLR